MYTQTNLAQKIIFFIKNIELKIKKKKKTITEYLLLLKKLISLFFFIKMQVMD
jgi:hypothetical protein